MDKQTKIIASITGAFLALAFLFRKPIKTMAKKILTDLDKQEFIKKTLPAANVIGNKIGVPPLFILAQICLESRYGASELAAKYNNFGGIKAVAGQPYVEFTTTECKNGVCYKTKAKFAKFPTVAAGLAAQATVLTNKYFKKYANKTTDPIQYAKLLQSGTPRYATALNYPATIASVLKEINRLLT